MAALVRAALPEPTCSTTTLPGLKEPAEAGEADKTASMGAEQQSARMVAEERLMRPLDQAEVNLLRPNAG